jgi:hypothetical protein
MLLGPCPSFPKLERSPKLRGRALLPPTDTGAPRRAFSALRRATSFSRSSSARNGVFAEVLAGLVATLGDALAVPVNSTHRTFR